MSSLIKASESSMRKFSEEQCQLIKNIICKGASDDEQAIFLALSEHLKLDPFAKQIWMIPRWDSKLQKTVYTPQVSIDGLRLVANRTGRYAPGPAPTVSFDKDGKLFSCTSFVKKMTDDGTWHTVEHTCYFSEYVQMYTDKKTGEKKPSGLWETMPISQLSKCSEAGALRKSFPAETAGAYAEGELDKDAVVDVTPVDEISQQELNELYELSVKAPELTQKIKEYFNINSFHHLSKRQYDIAKKRLSEEVSKTLALAMEGE